VVSHSWREEKAMIRLGWFVIPGAVALGAIAAIYRAHQARKTPPASEDAVSRFFERSRSAEPKPPGPNAPTPTE
jgi:hypothetical protein